MELVKFGKLKEQSYTMKESLRALKTNIQFCGDDIRTLLVTSSVPNEGKSTVALDLARSLTESGNRVLFIDTDMRKSVLAGRLRATAASVHLSVAFLLPVSSFSPGLVCTVPRIPVALLKVCLNGLPVYQRI